jgi:hypothetical protein
VEWHVAFPERLTHASSRARETNFTTAAFMGAPLRWYGKLITSEDPFHVHKLLGVSCLAHFIYRFGLVSRSFMIPVSTANGSADLVGFGDMGFSYVEKSAVIWRFTIRYMVYVYGDSQLTTYGDLQLINNSLYGDSHFDIWRFSIDQHSGIWRFTIWYMEISNSVSAPIYMENHNPQFGIYMEIYNSVYLVF